MGCKAISDRTAKKVCSNSHQTIRREVTPELQVADIEDGEEGRAKYTWKYKGQQEYRFASEDENEQRFFVAGSRQGWKGRE